MASDLQRAVTTIKLNDYQTLAILTAVGYDYILTFQKEVEYVWTKPWSRVSTLFVLVRYVGLCFIIADAILGSSFLPGPIKAYVFVPHQCYVSMTALCNQMTIGVSNALLLLQTWASLIFFGALDLVMILRVWALYHRSRKILVALLLLYAIELISYLIYCATSSTAKFVSLVGVVRVPNFAFCARLGGSTFWPDVVDSLQIAFGALMCVLVGVRFVQQSVEMYRATKQCRLSRYINALVREGVIYFFALLTYSVITILVAATSIPMYEPWTVLLGMVQGVPMLTLAPRFILNLRELYACDLERRFAGEIDTAFGLTSQLGRGTVGSAAIASSGTTENEGSGGARSGRGGTGGGVSAWPGVLGKRPESGGVEDRHDEFVQARRRE